MTPLTQKRFENPDEIREFTDGKGRVELVDLGGNAVRVGSDLSGALDRGMPILVVTDASAAPPRLGMAPT